MLHEFLDKFASAYLDDIIIYSKTKREHREHVHKVLRALQKAGLQLDINKCEFTVQETKYLGLIVTSDGIKMDPQKVEAIFQWKLPTGIKDLQSFIGFANFYRRFKGFSNSPSVDKYAQECSTMARVAPRGMQSCLCGTQL